MRYVVSDIHGCLDNLLELLEKVEFNEEKDILYILGDIVDRGPKIWETYLWVKERLGKYVFMILGNHEDMLINEVFTLKARQIKDMKRAPKDDKEKKYFEYMRRNYTIWDQYHTIARLMQEGHSLDELVDMCEFFEALPLYYVVDIYGTEYTLVHAFCEQEIEKTTKMDFVWERCLAEMPNYFVEGRTVIFGHTPTISITRKAEIIDEVSEDKKSEKINIDCGCVYGGKLAIMRLEDRFVLYSDNERK